VLDLPDGYSRGLQSLSDDTAPMVDDEGVAHAKQLAEYRAVEEEYADQNEIPDEIDTRLGVLETEMEKIETRSLTFDQTEIGLAAAFVTLDRCGALAVHRGYMRPEDEPAKETAVQDGVDPALAGQGDERHLSDGYADAAHVGNMIMSGGQPADGDLPEDEDDGVLKPLPEGLVMELTAHRTLALREAIRRSPDVALTFLPLKLVTDTFRTSGASGSCLEVSVRHAALCDCLSVLRQGTRLALVTLCFRFGVNALHEKVNLNRAVISAGIYRGGGDTSRHSRGGLAKQENTLELAHARSRKSQRCTKALSTAQFPVREVLPGCLLPPGHHALRRRSAASGWL